MMYRSLLSVVALVACGKSERAAPPTGTSSAAPAGGAPATPTPVTDACAVLAPGAIGAALGVAVGPGKPGPSSKTADGLPLVSCTWEQGQGTGADYSVTLEVQSYGSSDRAREVHAASRVAGGSLSFVDVPDVGDEAIFARLGADDRATTTGLYWRAGAAIYHLAATRLDKLDRTAIEPKLAALAGEKF